MLIFSQLQQSHHILLFNSQSLKETDQYRVYYGITKKAFQHSRRLTGTGARMASLHRNFNSQPHKETDRYDCGGAASYTISTHSLTRRLTAILFNKNRFVQFIFIALYQSPPTTSPPSSFFSPYFLIFSKNIRCESPEDWVGAWGSHYRIRVSVTSKPCFAPMCSTLFLYLSPR